MNDRLTPLPDENTLVIPKGWRRRLHTRRGGVPGPKITIGAAAGEALRSLEEDGRAEAERLVADPDCDRELAEGTRRHLAGDADPRGAALLATIMIGRNGVYSSESHERFVDGWTAVHGPAFAACAFTELCDIGVEPGQVGVDVYRMPPAARRLRALLAATGDQEYQEVVDRLAERRSTFMKRFITAYLVPTRLDWVDECCAAPPDGWGSRQMMLCTLGSAGQLELVGGWASLTYPDCYLENLATMAEGVGPAIAPLLAEAMDRLDPNPERRRALLDVLSALPSDEAFELLLERVDRPYFRAALLEAMKRYPVRAIRLLAQADGATAAELLDEHLSVNSEFLAAVAADLPAEVQEVVERITAAAERVPEAPAEVLPPLLADPPWAREKPKTKPVVIKGLMPATRPSMAWEPGERERWLHTGLFYPSGWPMDEPLEPGRHWESPPTYDKDPGWARRIEDLRSGRLLGYDEVPIITLGPEKLIRPLLADWRPRDWNSSSATSRPEEWMRHVVARYELDALPVAVQFATSNAARFGSLLLPYPDAQVAGLAADWLLRVKTAREVAVAWFDRHGAAAVRLLLPTALGRPGMQRRGAEYALHFLASELGGDALVEAARDHGDAAVGVIEELLASDPQELVPRKVPKVGEWAGPGVLPQVLLRGRERALPAAAVRHLVTMLAMSTPEEVDPGIAVVRELCDGESLAAFGWALFERWREYGEVAGDAWALIALGCLGDDETARRLTPIIRAWPGEGGHAKAVKGLDALALIGTDVALTQLHGIAQKVKFKALKQRAQEKIEQVADGLGLTGEQLGDRLVPGFGLDAGGSMVLDYGPRRFVVGFDEQLKPYVADEDGTRRKALPKPGAKDNADLAYAAYERFTELKKDVRAVAPIQLRRMELAMATDRRWTLAEFREYLVGHPLVWHIVRRLVWLAEDGDTATPFRLAEDGSFADVDDELFILPDSARVGIAHPLHLGEALGAWSEVFADYEILQPFPQLGRAVHVLSDEERACGRLKRFEGLSVPFGKVLALEKRGWRRGVPLDNGTERWISREVPGGRYVVLNLNPGIQVGYVDMDPEQKLEHVWLGDEPDDYFPDRAGPHAFGELDPVTASEVLADLTGLAESAS